ncbi:MAG: symmetrical bis(5'-nucleosyl)-tetraphosphatase [Herminiimonas sp.]|nr:symmetrical bis(5'-nucleosyl)-tetraphosphatase [Herminiimonas sp.]
MPTYAIGDLQGCHARLLTLLAHIDASQVATGMGADGDAAQYIFVGDIVNRGPQSLETLRCLRNLGARARMVLGNHDLHLLAAANGLRKPGRQDTLAPILNAPDRDDLLAWLRRQPLALVHADHLVVHAGVLPQWSVTQTLALAGEVSQMLQGPHWRDFLGHMYGNQPARWDETLTGHERLRCIVNALTRMRLCTPDGSMILDDAKPTVPDGRMPWFDVPGRRSADATVVFGHWSSIGLQLRPNLIGLDTGCLWGGKLTAVRLEDRALFQVDCPQYQVPGSVGG